MNKHQHKLKKKSHFKKPAIRLRRCKLINTGLKDGLFRYEPGSIFLFEQSYDKKGHPYMRVYRTEDAESYWPFSISTFYNVFKILR